VVSAALSLFECFLFRFKLLNSPVDIFSYHPYRPYEGLYNWLNISSGLDEWINEVPLRDRRNGNVRSGGRDYRSSANQYRAWAAAWGREDLLIANNEYGFGHIIQFSGFTRYTKGLLVTELLMEHFIGNWYSSCFWDLTRWIDEGLLDKTNAYRLNPAHLGMQLLAKSQGGTYLHTISTDLRNVHGFAAASTDDAGTILVYLINKSGGSRSIQVSLTNNAAIQSANALLMTNSTDGYGELQSLPMQTPLENIHSRSILLPNFSFAQIAIVPVVPASRRS
jgi:hypothetical protein